jgi:hypothetical protein
MWMSTPKCLAFLLIVVFLASLISIARADVDYTLVGPLNENTGTIMTGINIIVEVYPVGGNPYNVTMSGTGGPWVYTNQTSTVSQLRSFLPNNMSRYYDASTGYTGNLTWWVFVPDSPYYVYYASVAVIGQTVSNAYLESYILLNGTEFIVERRIFTVGNLIPFVFTQGRPYGFIFTCTQGTVDLGTQIMGDPLLDIQLMATPQNFPSTASTFGNITVSATRMNDTWIQALYNDGGGTTFNVTTTITLNGQTEFTSAAISNSSTVDWNNGLSDQDYTVTITAQTSNGQFQWTTPVSHNFNGGNPFAGLNSLGPSLPMKVTDLIWFIVDLIIFSTASIKDSHIILLLVILLTAFEGLIGFMSVPSSSVTVCFLLGVLWALSKRRTT